MGYRASPGRPKNNVLLNNSSALSEHGNHSRRGWLHPILERQTETRDRLHGSYTAATSGDHILYSRTNSFKKKKKIFFFLVLTFYTNGINTLPSAQTTLIYIHSTSQIIEKLKCVLNV